MIVAQRFDILREQQQQNISFATRINIYANYCFQNRSECYNDDAKNLEFFLVHLPNFNLLEHELFERRKDRKN